MCVFCDLFFSAVTNRCTRLVVRFNKSIVIRRLTLFFYFVFFTSDVWRCFFTLFFLRQTSDAFFTLCFFYVRRLTRFFHFVFFASDVWRNFFYLKKSCLKVPCGRSSCEPKWDLGALFFLLNIKFTYFKNGVPDFGECKHRK